MADMSSPVTGMGPGGPMGQGHPQPMGQAMPQGMGPSPPVGPMAPGGPMMDPSMNNAPLQFNTSKGKPPMAKTGEDMAMNLEGSDHDERGSRNKKINTS